MQIGIFEVKTAIAKRLGRLASWIRHPGWHWFLLIFLFAVIPCYSRNYIINGTAWNSARDQIYFDFIVSLLGAANYVALIFLSLQFPRHTRIPLLLLLVLFHGIQTLYWLTELLFFKSTGGLYTPSVKGLGISLSDGMLFAKSGFDLVSPREFWVFTAVSLLTLQSLFVVTTRSVQRRHWFWGSAVVALSFIGSVFFCAQDRIRRMDAWSLPEALEVIWSPRPTSSFLSLRNYPFPLNFLTLVRGSFLTNLCDASVLKEIGDYSAPAVELQEKSAIQGVTVIAAQLESINQMAAFASYDKNDFVMPYLRQLLLQSGVNETNFNFYSSAGAGLTSDAEFSQLCGLESSRTVGSFFRIEYLKMPCLPTFFRTLGFKTIAAHANQGSMYNRINAYPILGFSKIFLAQEIKKNIVNDTSSQYWPSDKWTMHYILSQLSQNEKDSEFVHFVGIESHGPYKPLSVHQRIIPYDTECVSCDTKIVDGFAALANSVDQGLAFNLTEIQSQSLRNSRKYVIYIYGDHGAGLRRDIFQDVRATRKSIEEVQTIDLQVPYVALIIENGKLIVLPMEKENLLPGLGDHADIGLILAAQLQRYGAEWSRDLGSRISSFLSDRRPLDPSFAIAQSYVVTKKRVRPFAQSRRARVDIAKTEIALDCRLN